MKVSKLLVIAISVLAIALPASASDITLQKNVTPATPNVYVAGGTIDYVITVTNASGSENIRIDSVVDTFPDATVETLDDTFDASFPSLPYILAPGASQVYNVSWAIPIATSGVVINSVHVTGIQFSTPVNDTVDATVTKNSLVVTPDISIEKVGDIEAFCEGSDPTVTYTYFVENTGNEDLTNIVVSDDECNPVQPVDDDADTFNDGDDNEDGYINPSEIWEYECSVQLTESTLNTATVNGEGRYTAEPVSDTDSWEVLEVLPPTVSVDPASAEICETADVELCAVVVPAETAPPSLYTYSWKKDDVLMVGETGPCITVSEAGRYCVTVTDIASQCQASACSDVTVIEAPDCSINSGPRSICEDAIGTPVEYCATDLTADGYEWEVISGPADPILPEDNGLSCVEITPTGLGTIVLELRTWNDVAPDGACGASCRITILVEECGGTFCSFTQGFWGNAGGKKCGGQTTSELIAAALAANGGTITVGIPPRSITFNSVQCILDSLPAGGTPSALPAVGGPWTCANLSSFYKNKNKTEINNVLVGQAVALTLNLLVSEGCVEDSGILADWVLPAEFCTVPYGDEEACAEYSSIPTSMVGKTVAEMLAAVNAALAGTGSISDAYGAATAINEGFDECRTLVPCIRPEICGNGCDDDGDGLVDGDDIVDCPPIIVLQ